MEKHIPKEVLFVINKLEAKGYEAYITGGAVRDLIMGREPYDWDIATNALPSQVIAIFDKTIDRGIKYGTVIINAGSGINVDVTTYRSECGYSDFRRPEEVEFISDLYEDLRRRDFTINAIAYNPHRGYVDYFFGVKDIKKRMIRCIGNPSERLTEDALRMLRAVRFAAVLDFTITEQTFQAIKQKAHLLKMISAERINKEFSAILACPDAGRGFKILKDAGLLDIIIPEFSRLSNNAYIEMTRLLDHIKGDLECRLSVVLYYLGKDGEKIKGFISSSFEESYPAKYKVVPILMRLKYSSAIIKSVENIMILLDETIPEDPKSVRRAMSRVELKDFRYYIDIMYAKAKVRSDEDLYQKVSKIDALSHESLNKKHAISIKELSIDGNDLKALGIQGVQIGETLNYLLEKVIDNPDLNNSEDLKYIAELWKNGQGGI